MGSAGIGLEAGEETVGIQMQIPETFSCFSLKPVLP